MKHAQHTLVALYDATPEHVHFESPFVMERARLLGRALGGAGLGAIAHMGPAIVTAAFAELHNAGIFSIALSPASNREEHTTAFRLPTLATPLIYTGRGALGADMMALGSAHAAIIMGSYPGALESIIDHARTTTIPLGILSDEEPSAIHERVRARNPHLGTALFVSHDPEILVRALAEELRRRELSQKLS